MSVSNSIPDAEKILTVWVALSLKRGRATNYKVRRVTGWTWPTICRWQRELMPDCNRKSTPAQAVEWIQQANAAK